MFNATNKTLITSAATDKPDQSPTTSKAAVVQNATSTTLSTAINTADTLTDPPTTNIAMSFFTG